MTAPDTTLVRKARRSSRLACGCYVLTGSVIVRRGGRWLCLQCALEAIRATAGAKADRGHAR